jgi:hypothetical protein
MNGYNGHSKYGAYVPSAGAIVPLNMDGTNDWDGMIRVPEYVWVRGSARNRPHWRAMDTRPYTIHTYADGFGAWCARISFRDGAGNTAQGVNLFERAMQDARHRIAHELIMRSPQGTPWPRIRTEVIANRENASGALASITIREK